MGEPPSTFRGAGESSRTASAGTMRLASAVRVEGVVVEIAEAIERIRRRWRGRLSRGRRRISLWRRNEAQRLDDGPRPGWIWGLASKAAHELAQLAAVAQLGQAVVEIGSRDRRQRPRLGGRGSPGAAAGGGGGSGGGSGPRPSS